MRLPHILLTVAFFAYFSKLRISHIFPHKLEFSTAILILFVYRLPITIGFRYLDHLVANRMAPSMCPDPYGMRSGYFWPYQFLLFSFFFFFSTFSFWIKVTCQLLSAVKIASRIVSSNPVIFSLKASIKQSNSVPYFRTSLPHSWCLCGPHIFFEDAA